jgi:hypothetical protein
MTKHKLPTIKEIAKLLMHCKKYIHVDSRAFDDDDTPSMQITIGINTESGEWGYQTGDNSFTGGAYLYPTWGVGYLFRNSNCREVAKEILADAESCLY